MKHNMSDDPEWIRTIFLSVQDLLEHHHNSKLARASIEKTLDAKHAECEKFRRDAAAMADAMKTARGVIAIVLESGEGAPIFYQYPKLHGQLKHALRDIRNVMALTAGGPGAAEYQSWDVARQSSTLMTPPPDQGVPPSV